MLNPDDLVAAWVAKLQSISDLRDALGVEGAIVAYQDVYPGETNLRRAIVQQPPGSLMVVWQGAAPRRFAGVPSFQHQFSIIVRPPQSDDRSITAKICALLVNGIDPANSLKLLHSPIHPACEPMDLDLPSLRRQTLLVSADGETLDYFELTATLMEIGDN